MTLGFPGYWEGRQRVVVEPDSASASVIDLRSPYLVSAGQSMRVAVSAQIVEVPKPDPGASLVWALVTPICADLGMKISITHQYEYIPSARPLWEILQDVAQHGTDWASHGTDCVCMDKFSYELKHHILRALPERTEKTYTNSAEWEKDFNARMRIRHVLRMASNIL